jgi:hypothetical protein
MRNEAVIGGELRDMGKHDSIYEYSTYCS